MAQTTVDLDSKVLLESGFLPLDDPTTERDVNDLELRNFQFFTEQGLEFLKRQVLDDKRFRSAIKAFFGQEKCVLAHWVRYGNRPGFVECHVKGGPKAGHLALMVHVLARGSRVDYYRASHMRQLRTIDGQRGLFEVDALEVADLELWVAGDEKLTEGGKYDITSSGDSMFLMHCRVVLDGRLCFQIAQSYTITFIFTTEALAMTLPKMSLPNSDELVLKIKDMEKFLQEIAASEGINIGLNFRFLAPPGNAGVKTP